MLTRRVPSGLYASQVTRGATALDRASPGITGLVLGTGPPRCGGTVALTSAQLIWGNALAVTEGYLLVTLLGSLDPLTVIPTAPRRPEPPLSAHLLTGFSLQSGDRIGR